MRSNKQLKALQVILVSLLLIVPMAMTFAAEENEIPELTAPLESTQVSGQPSQEELEEPVTQIPEFNESPREEPIIVPPLVPISEPSLELGILEEDGEKQGTVSESFLELPEELLARNFGGRKFNPLYNNDQINHRGVPNLANTRDWWTHLYHYNTRLFFLTYLNEYLPPVGYEVGSESRLIIPKDLYLPDSRYYKEHMLRGILHYDASEIPARLVVQNPQQSVWTSNPGAYTSALATAAYRSSSLQFLTGAESSFTTSDGVFRLTLRRVNPAERPPTDLEIIVRRERAVPSNASDFSGFEIEYRGQFVRLQWSSSGGWQRITGHLQPFTGSFHPTVELKTVTPELAISKIKDGVLEVNDSFSENPLDYVRIDKKMNQGRQTARFLTHPNTSRLGRQSVTVQVTDSYGGFRNTQSINVVFDVRNTLTAEGVPQVWNVGTELNALDSKTLLRNVRRKGSQLNSRDYEAQLISSSSLIHVGEEEWRVRLTYQGHSNTAVEIPVKVTVQWGNSLRLLSNNFNTAMAVTLHKDAQNNLVVRGVKGLPSPGWNYIHAHFRDKYFHVGIYRLNQGEQTYEKLERVTYFEKTGHDLIQTAYQSLSSQPVEVGDLVGIYHREVSSIQQMLRLYTNNIESQPYTTQHYNQPTSYYEVTDNGFKPRYFNQLKTRQHSLPIFTESSALEQEITRFFDPHTGLNQGNYQFISPPPTNVSGPQVGKVAVSERLEGSKRISYPYDIELLVGQGSLVATVPSNMNFYDYQITSTPQIIQRREANWSIKVNDRRGDNQQPVWRIISRVERNPDGLSRYYVYRQGETVTPLDQGVEVYRSGNENRAGPILTEINWARGDGIQLKVPSNPPLQGNQNYQDRIEWSLIQGP